MNDDAFRPLIKVAICGTGNDPHASALGRGVVSLLELVEVTGSLHKAAQEMGMAYSKAWRIVKETESALDCMFMERMGPKGSVLTADGKRLIAVYREFESRMRKAADSLLAECFQEIRE